MSHHWWSLNKLCIWKIKKWGLLSDKEFSIFESYKDLLNVHVSHIWVHSVYLVFLCQKHCSLSLSFINNDVLMGPDHPFTPLILHRLGQLPILLGLHHRNAGLPPPIHAFFYWQSPNDGEDETAYAAKDSYDIEDLWALCWLVLCINSYGDGSYFLYPVRIVGDS